MYFILAEKKIKGKLKQNLKRICSIWAGLLALGGFLLVSILPSKTPPEDHPSTEPPEEPPEHT